MHVKKEILFCIILSLLLLLGVIACETAKSKSKEQPLEPQSANSKYMENITSRVKPPIYKDWNNYPDIKGLNKYELAAKCTLTWETIEAKGSSSKSQTYGSLLGLEWDKSSGEFPGLSKTVINVEEAKKVYDMVKKMNPNTLFGIEVRWDALKDFELPPKHKFWKRDKKGNRVRYSQASPPRYEVKETDPEYLNWLAERCKAIMDTGVVDFIFFDHMKYIQDQGGTPLPMLQVVRKKLGPDAIIIGNTHFIQMNKISEYIDAWGEDQELSDYTYILNFWETHGRIQPRFNAWEFYGPADDLKKMRFFTTLVMTNSNASLRYINHTSTTKPSPWYDFWDVTIGKFKGGKIMMGDCFAREYENGTTVCNNTADPKKVTFNEMRQRASNGDKAKEFTIDGKDGDMFLYVK